jgi:hypothetical protein
MTRLLLAAVLLAAGCNGAERFSPADPAAGADGAGMVTVLGAIKGYNNDDPRIDVQVNGRTVEVTVSTYGGGCHRLGATETQVVGMSALVVPFDHTAPPGTPCTRQLVEMRHRATLGFASAGTARIRVRGIDASTRHGGNMAGDTIEVERTVTLR